MGLDLVRRLDAAVEVLEEEREADASEGRRRTARAAGRGGVSGDRVARGTRRGRRRGCCSSSAPPRRPSPSRAAAGCRRSAGCSPTSRCSTPYSIPLRFSASASGFCWSSAPTRLFSCARAVWYSSAHRLHHLRDLPLQPRLRHLDGGLRLDHVRMVVAELLAQLRLLALQVGQLRLLLLDEARSSECREGIERGAVRLRSSSWL